MRYGGLGTLGQAAAVWALCQQNGELATMVAVGIEYTRLGAEACAEMRWLDMVHYTVSAGLAFARLQNVTDLDTRAADALLSGP